MNPGEFFIVTSVRRKLSHRNHEYYVEFEMVDLDSGKIWKTYSSENNYNWTTRNWGDLYNQTQYWLQNGRTPCIAGKWQVTKPGIISADSYWHLDEVFDLAETLDQIAQRYFS